MSLKDVHINLSSVLCVLCTALLWGLNATPWWSCSDSSEVRLRLGIWGIAAFLLGGSVILMARQFKKAEMTNYFCELFLRGMLLYTLITTSLIKARGIFFNYSMITEETKIGELDKAAFINVFYGSNDFYQSYLGYALIVGLLFICFRQTMRIGNLILLALLTNAAVMAYAFDSCHLIKNSVYAFSALALVFVDLPSYVSFFTKDSKHINTTNSYHPLKNMGHIYKSLSLYKLILFAGLMLYNYDYIKDVEEWRTQNKDNPIAGVWEVKDIIFMKDEKEVSQETKEAVAHFQKFILDKGRWGAVEVQDSLSFFEYIIDPRYNQLEFWNFQDFRKIDLKGRYNQVATDSIVYVGRSNKDSLVMHLKLTE